MIEWNGKGDVDVAVAAWQKLLKVNPNLPQKNKDQVEYLIKTAKQSKAPLPKSSNLLTLK